MSTTQVFGFMLFVGTVFTLVGAMNSFISRIPFKERKPPQTRQELADMVGSEMWDRVFRILAPITFWIGVTLVISSVIGFVFLLLS